MASCKVVVHCRYWCLKRERKGAETRNGLNVFRFEPTFAVKVHILNEKTSGCISKLKSHKTKAFDVFFLLALH